MIEIGLELDYLLKILFIALRILSLLNLLNKTFVDFSDAHCPAYFNSYFQ